ncbi:hypothetical protein L6278_00150 [Candidatus Parcubacteria bacterium]|nr:hypothetical protein [Candidatus Parcubacteria bacterium]
MSIDLSQLNTKKILLIILFLAVCFGLGFGIYFLFFRATDTAPGQEIYSLPGKGLPQSKEGFGAEVVCEGNDCGSGLPEAGDVELGAEQTEPDKIAQGRQTLTLPMFEDKVVSPTLSTDGNGIAFYNSEDNKFYIISEASEEPILLSDQEFFNVENVFWSINKTQAIITYPDGSKILYDFVARKQTTLNKEINEPVFSNANDVAYKHLSFQEDGENNWLAVTNPLSGQTQLIEPLGDNADFVQIAWSPGNEVVALYSDPIGLDKSEIFFIGLQAENNKSLIVDGSNFKGLWSLTGNKILYSVVSAQNNYNPQLWIVDARQDVLGQHKFNLGLSTWVDKCVFANETKVYCAVPKELQEGAGLYPELITNTSDMIYEINLITGFSKLLADPVLSSGGSFSISKIYLSRNGQYLFFWDSLTQQIYKIQLK